MADTSLKKNSNKTSTKTAAKESLGRAVEKAVTGSFNGVPEITFEEVVVRFCRIKHFSFSRHTRGSVFARLRRYR